MSNTTMVGMPSSMVHLIVGVTVTSRLTPAPSELTDTTVLSSA